MQILKKLQNQGFELDKRTVQRDLNSLSDFFAIQTDGNKVENTQTKIKKPADFNLQKYIEQGRFLFPKDNDNKIKLLIKANQYWANYLSENKLSNDQKIAPTDDDLSKIYATVQDTQQLKWWLFIPFSRSNYMNIVPIIVLPMFIKNLSHSHSSNGDFL